MVEKKIGEEVRRRKIDGCNERPLPDCRHKQQPTASSSAAVFSPVALPRPKVSVEVCSSAPSEVEASKLAEASLSASPDQGRDQDAAGFRIM